MRKFHNFSIADTVFNFFMKILTPPNEFKLHMHVSDDDSNKFCTFDAICLTLKRCGNFIIFI